MLSVHCEWTLKLSPAPHPPSSGHLLKRGVSPRPPCSRPAYGLAPLHTPTLATIDIQVYLFPSLGGRSWDLGGRRGPATFFHGTYTWRGPRGHCSGRPPDPPVSASLTPPHVQRLKICLHPAPHFLKHFLDLFPLFLLKDSLYRDIYREIYIKYSFPQRSRQQAAVLGGHSQDQREPQGLRQGQGRGQERPQLNVTKQQ